MKMTSIVTTIKKVVRGIDFGIVVKAMDQSNVCSYIHEEVEIFLKGKNLINVPHVFMATHSIGGRHWILEEGAQPAYFDEECFNGGWYVLREEEVKYLECQSATSSSTLWAEKQQDGFWNLSLEVPVGDDGQPYKGRYYKSFMTALGQEIAEAA